MLTACLVFNTHPQLQAIMATVSFMSPFLQAHPSRFSRNGQVEENLGVLLVREGRGVEGGRE